MDASLTSTMFHSSWRHLQPPWRRVLVQVREPVRVRVRERVRERVLGQLSGAGRRREPVPVQVRVRVLGPVLGDARFPHLQRELLLMLGVELLEAGERMQAVVLLVEVVEEAHRVLLLREEAVHHRQRLDIRLVVP